MPEREVESDETACGMADWERRILVEFDQNEEIARLRAWKQEAMTLFDGLQDLGRALDLPLGVLVTGPLAVEAANNLRAERDAAREELARLRCSSGRSGGEDGE